MHLLRELVIIPAPLAHDREARRWYAQGGKSCLALSDAGHLLQPLPTFGPSCYALIATHVQPPEADTYALIHGFPHVRVLPRPG